jgi:putative addiction module component (TIGR02574 family)
MSASRAELFENVLALPQMERADLAFRLLQSLDPPGSDISNDKFGDELLARATAARRGELESLSLQEVRDQMEQRFGKRTDL